MEIADKATRIRLADFSSVQMRAFHMAWIAFFLCFFAWFGVAPLMPVIRKQLNLTPQQVGNTIIASVAATIAARIVIGWLCDRLGPRITYTVLLMIGALPVIGIGFANSYESFLLFRLAIGAIGASFVLTQYHTSMMFAPNCVGTANATTAGWGNMGGGAAQLVMPLVLAALLALGFSDFWGWRLSMVLPGIGMFAAGIAYFAFTQDTPQGSVLSLRRQAKASSQAKQPGTLLAASKDPRVWALGLIYGACFGVEITIHNVAALYFTDEFNLGIKSAGAIVGAFGLLAIFARTTGGWISDRASLRFGSIGRITWLGGSILLQGLLLILFSRMTAIASAVAALMLFGLFVHTSCGATYAIIPFLNRRAVGSVAGLVGAGGNLGAVLSGLLFRGTVGYQSALLLLGILVTVSSMLVLLVHLDEMPAPTAAPTARAAQPLDEVNVSIPAAAAAASV
jgi:MFS transporter, NNP family, nitrate/nitrite transporter